MLSLLFSLGVRAFVIGLSQISSLYSCQKVTFWNPVLQNAHKMSYFTIPRILYRVICFMAWPERSTGASREWSLTWPSLYLYIISSHLPNILHYKFKWQYSNQTLTTSLSKGFYTSVAPPALWVYTKCRTSRWTLLPLGSSVFHKHILLGIRFDSKMLWKSFKIIVCSPEN